MENKKTYTTEEKIKYYQEQMIKAQRRLSQLYIRYADETLKQFQDYSLEQKHNKNKKAR